MEPGIRTAALAHVEHRGECGKAGRRVHHDPAGEIEDAMLLQNATAPDHVGNGEIDQEQPRDEKEQIRLECHAIREGARDERRRDLGEHHLVGDEDDERDGG